MSLTLADFDFDLPASLIAQHPPKVRAAGRLLHVEGPSGVLADRMFADLPSLVAAGDVFVFNDTKVIKARLSGEKSTGGKIEVMVERIVGPNRVLAHVRASKSPRAGAVLSLQGGIMATVEERQDDLYALTLHGEGGVLEILERHGSTPLPPYITHAPDAEDDARYQTVYARFPGAVAAPTAGLHFDSPTLAALADASITQAFVTLHVGAGTFQPVRGDDISRHDMHAEWFHVPDATVAAINAARARGSKVWAVGTTAVRALESASQSGVLIAGEGMTRLFIQPGYRVRTVDRLITNFHLPKSTLLMLVSAFAGHANIRNAYAHAVACQYRFFSYGDAMLLEHTPDPFC